MSATKWNGNAAAVTPTSGYARKTVAGATNASPIVMNVVAHGFNTGDSVEQEGIGGNTAANGLFQITRVDANHYNLNGTTGNGAYTSGGYAIDYELQPALSMPTNGTLADVNDVVAMGEGLSNPAPYLYRAAGKWKLYNQFYGLTGNILYTQDQTAPYYSANVTSATQAEISSSGNSPVTLESLSDTPSGPVPIIGAADLLEFNITGSILVGSNSLPDVGTLAILPCFVQGSNVQFCIGMQTFGATDEPVYAGFSLTGMINTSVMASAGIVLPGALSIGLATGLRKTPGGTLSINLNGQLSYVVKQYRAN
jgi:hypothetical protein